MRRTVCVLGAGVLVLVAAGCSGKICEKAAKKYTDCVEKKLGPQMAKLARSKQEAGIEACKKDDKTQKMYKKCLPEKSCDKFMDCLMDYARKEGPKMGPADRPKKEAP